MNKNARHHAVEHLLGIPSLRKRDRAFRIIKIFFLLGYAIPSLNAIAANRAEDEASGFVTNISWRWIPYQAPYTPPDSYWQYDGGGPFSYDNGYAFKQTAVQDAHSVYYSSALNLQRFTYCGPPSPLPPTLILYNACGGGNSSVTFTAFWATSQAPGELLFNDSNGVQYFGKCPNGTELRTESGKSTSLGTDPEYRYCYTPRQLSSCQERVATSTSSDFETSTWFGNPCDAATGAKSQLDTDFAGIGDLPGLARQYHSQVKLDTGFGVGWLSPFHKRLIISTTANGRIYAQRHNGNADAFNCVLTGECTRYAQTGMARDSGGYTLRNPDGTSERYDTTGRLVSEADRGGVVNRTYTYGGTGQLSSVASRFGHTLLFTYDNSNHIAAVTDPLGAVYSYSYDPYANLTHVSYPDGTTTRYHYENPQAVNALTGISYVDANGVATRYATYSYDSGGLVTATEHAGGIERFTFSYDSSTQATVTDAIGNSQVLTFVPSGSPSFLGRTLTAKTTTTDGKTVRQTFNSTNDLICKIDEEGHITEYRYNAARGPVRFETQGLGGTCTAPITTPLTRQFTYEYVSDPSSVLALPTVIQSPSIYLGQTKRISIGYDGARNPVSITQSGYTPSGTSIGRTVTLAYNASGQVTAINGPRTDVNDVTTLAYYSCTSGGACGQLASVTNAAGHVTTYDSYDGAGRLLQMTDPNGLRTHYGYDARGRVTSVTQTPPGGTGRTTSFAYNAAGNVTFTGFPDGRTLTYTYNAAQQSLGVVDNLGNRISYGYDLKGNRTQEYTYDPDGTLVRAIEIAYDVRNRVAQVNRGGSLTQQVMDAVGNLTRVTDPNQVAAGSGIGTSHAYDALNRLIQTLDNLNGSTSYGYNNQDRLTQVSAPNGATTQYGYDDLGNLLSETSPDRGTTTYTYDAAGNVLSQTDARGISVGYTYDALNRLIGINYPTDTDVSYTYDSGSNCTQGIGRLCQVVDAAGTMQYGYDAFGNVTTQIKTELGRSYTTTYGYDLGHRVTSITYPDNRVVSYGRDGGGRITTVQATVNGTTVPIATGRTYRADGLLLGQSYGNGINEVRTYDTQGRMTYQSLGAVDTRVYTYDANGNLKQKQSLPEVGNYSYDLLDRLSDVARTAAASVTELYRYDGNGNRTQDVSGSYSYVSASNRMSTRPGGTPTLDVAGNTVNDGQGLSLTYNNAGQIATATKSDITASYTYNAQRQRTRKVEGTTTTVYHYDVSGNLIGETQSNGTPIRAYVYADDIPIAQIDLTPAGEAVQYLHGDHQGTPRVATDASQTVRWRWDGDAFGATPPNEDPDGDGSLTTVNLRYGNSYYDTETGLFYGNDRYYDPKSGRWITADRMSVLQHFKRWRGRLGRGGEATPESNPYAYGRNNPLRYTDPTGKVAIADDVIIIGGTVLVGGCLASQGCRDALSAGAKACADAIDRASDLFSDLIFSRPPGFWSGDKGAEEWGRRNGVGADEGRRRFHGVKQGAGGRGRDNYSTNPETGDVVDQNGDDVGNLNDAKAK